MYLASGKVKLTIILTVLGVGAYFLFKENPTNILIGGMGDTTDEEDVDPDELEMGIEVEKEHTRNKKIAKEIALDHLTEDPEYYTKLKAIHKENPVTSNRSNERQPLRARRKA